MLSVNTDDAGNTELIRTVFALWYVCAFLLWVSMCVRSGWVLADIPTGLATVLVSLPIGKALQRFAEVWKDKRPAPGTGNPTG